jgi:GNAT superfamily N-acetyltransferase
MSVGSPASDELATRARDFQRATQAAVCDRLEPWAHGTVLGASRHPTYYAYNLVRVEEDPRMDADELVAFADDALAGLGHRRIDFEVVGAADARRPAFEAKGWHAVRLLWMRHEHEPPPGPEVDVVEIDYDEADPLRRAWAREDHEQWEYEQYRIAAREVALARGVRVLAVIADDQPVAFAHIERGGEDAEISQVYVHPDHRGGGYGTALTRAAILARGDARELWIMADDEDRPKHLYARLGFRPAWHTMELTRVP